MHLVVSSRIIRVTFVVAGLLACTLAGCSPGVRGLPVHRDMAFQPLGEISGLLTKAGDCVYIDEGDGNVLPVWPSDTWLDGTSVMRGQALVAVVGQRVHFSGGFLPTDAIQQTMDTPLPSCPAAAYFLISGNAKPCDAQWIPGPGGNVRPWCAP